MEKKKVEKLYKEDKKCNEALATRKRARDEPFVQDYRPYSGRQLSHILESRASHKDHWNLYYRNNSINGYRDRHYIIREFHELREALNKLKTEEFSPEKKDFIWMEAGCGVGNAFIPVLEEYGNFLGWRIIGFDISFVAIKLLHDKMQSLPVEYQEKLIIQVLDPVEEEIIPIIRSLSSTTSLSSEETNIGHLEITENLVDFVSMIFVLCSIPVEKHILVLQRIIACMKEDGIFFFRDYCVEDHAEKRFSSQRQVEENTFARTNGTLSHFFSIEEIRQLFNKVGFEVVELVVVERDVLNRKQGLNLHRKFLQGRFRKTKCNKNK